MLLRERAQFDLAVKLREGAATVGEIYSFISGLYFRGKMAYAEAFPNPPTGVPPALVIVPGAGLLPPETIVSEKQLRAIAAVPVDERNEAYRNPLVSGATLINEYAGPGCRFVLLGS